MSNAANSDPREDPLGFLFQSIGLSQVKAKETAKSKNAATLKDIIERHLIVSKATLDDKQAGLVVTLAGALNKSAIGFDEREYIVARIVERQLKSVEQVTGKLPYFEKFNLNLDLAPISRCYLYGNSQATCK